MYVVASATKYWGSTTTAQGDCWEPDERLLALRGLQQLTACVATPSHNPGTCLGPFLCICLTQPLRPLDSWCKNSMQTRKNEQCAQNSGKLHASIK
ncbi:hypothetical protein Pelo_3637 [Pelomyxa schiedti]|nr:hypothetical protein Pelo_3637 [Pelomyxa schiedti]